MRQFVHEFIEASEGETPERELSLYAPRVKYFDSGTVSLQAIASDQRKYYARWPQRDFTLLGEPQIVRGDGETVTVRYRMRYNLRRGQETASGQTEHVLSLEGGTGGWKIADIRERKAPER